jgi:hypothetical protein
MKSSLCFQLQEPLLPKSIVSVLSAIKRVLLPSGRSLRTLRAGPGKGLRMHLDLASQAQRYFGFDERELFGPLLQLMPQCRSMVDVGANDGYYTLMFLRSQAERVVACEPGPLQRLLENAEANDFQPGRRFQIINREIGLGASQMPLKEVAQDLPGPILIKLDVEGGELDVLKSAEPFQRLGELRWIVETHSLELEQQCLEWFRGHGFAGEIICNAPWRKLLPETRLVAHNRWIVATPAPNP